MLCNSIFEKEWNWTTRHKMEMTIIFRNIMQEWKELATKEDFVRKKRVERAW